MYKLYFKQAVQMLKQNKFISLIAILGTALAIMMIMAILVTDEIKNISTTPEINRNHTYYLTGYMVKDSTTNSWSTGDLTLDLVKEYISDLKTPELISTVSVLNMFGNEYFMSRPGLRESYPVHLKCTDMNYWKMLSFDSIEGTPFSGGSFESGLKEIVLSENLANKLFKRESALGQTILMNEESYKVTGVIKNVSAVFKMAYAEAWVPYTADKSFNYENYTVMLLIKDKKDYHNLLEEIKGIEKKYDIEKHPWILRLTPPLDQKAFAMDMDVDRMIPDSVTKDIQVNYRKKFVILLILLLVPAINLSGLSLSRIKKRTEEIGLRKAFGAKRHVIIIQVLYENMITSLIGGFIGFFLSYLVVYHLRYWLLNIPPDQALPVNTLFSFPVFLSVCIVCLLINLLSAGLSAYRAANTPIIQSITQNEKIV